MAKRTWVNLAVSEQTRLKALMMKKERTMDELISAMIHYFEFTKYDPFSLVRNPTLDRNEVFTKEIERLIKIVKAQEKDIFKPMYELLKDVSFKKDFSTSTETTSEVSVDELKLIVEKNQELEENLQEEQAKNSKLRLENESLKVQNSVPNSTNINVDVIIQSIEVILENAKSNRLKDGEMLIPRRILEGYLDRIRKEVEK